MEIGENYQKEICTIPPLIELHLVANSAVKKNLTSDSNSDDEEVVTFFVDDLFDRVKSVQQIDNEIK